MSRYSRIFSKTCGIINPVSIKAQTLNYGNSTNQIKIVSKEALIDLLKEPNFLLLDVRNPDEVELGMIPSALNIPLDGLYSAFKLDDQKFKLKFGFTKPDKEQKVIFYCQSGRRSQTACELASALGYKDVANYKGSWIEWSSS